MKNESNELVFNGDKAYQGDVLIQRTTIPEEAEEMEKADSALAYGEATGHAHVVDGSVQFLKFQGRRFIRVHETSTLQHLKNMATPTGEHDSFVLPPGDYQYDIAKEYDYDAEEMRRVTD